MFGGPSVNNLLDSDLQRGSFTVSWACKLNLAVPMPCRDAPAVQDQCREAHGCGRDRLAAFLPRIVSMNRAVSPSPGPSGQPLPVGIGIYTSRIDRHSRASGNPDTPRQYWIPACAGMTAGCCGVIGRFLQNHWVDELCRYLCPVGEGESVRLPAAGSWKAAAVQDARMPCRTGK